MADCVFPLFLFLVGVCVALSVDRDAVRAGEASGIWPRVLRRAAILFALGLLENAYLRLSLDNLRIPGVLQRIAVVYLAVAWLHVRLGKKALVALSAVVLVGYWLLLTGVPVPGLGQPGLTPQANLEGWLDRLVFGSHIWRGSTSWDPEGVLSTLPAIVLGLLGVLAGRWLRGGGEGAPRIFALGLGGAVLGLVWDGWLPLNKSLCTSSFVLFVGGVAVMLLAAAHALLDGRGPVGWAKPVIVIGTNPLALYVVASFTASTLRHVKLAGGPAGAVNLQAYLYQKFFSAWPDAALASAAWGLLFLLAMELLAWALFTRRIVIKL